MRQYIRERPFSRVASSPTDGGRYHPLFSYSPFLLLLPLLRFPCHLLLLFLFLPISPASFLDPGTHSITTTPLTRPHTAPGSVLESINVTGETDGNGRDEGETDDREMVENRIGEDERENTRRIRRLNRTCRGGGIESSSDPSTATTLSLKRKDIEAKYSGNKIPECHRKSLRIGL